ncbi:glycosyltransferase family 4 protein [Streptomyces sp. NPDC002671]
MTIVQPFLTEYRQSFFRRLSDDLRSHGIGLTIAHGAPYSRGISARSDAIAIDGAMRLPQYSTWVMGRPLVYKRLGPLLQSSDVLVLDQALHNLELYPQLARQRRSRGPAVSMWDHGRTYAIRQSRIEESVKYALTRQARWFFAYTEGGARSVVQHGFPRDRVTVVQNSTDTVALRENYRSVPPDQLSRFRAEFGLTPGRTVLYVGALSTTKRIPFLLEAAEYAARLLPDFRLLIAGLGEELERVTAAAEHSTAIIPVGQAYGARKALLGAASELMLMPGPVGLCAVDSFALQTPIVTTHWPFHGPEFEYLGDGRNAVVAPNDPSAYARTVVALLTDQERLAALQRHCGADACRYTVEEMSRRFTEGLVRLVGEIRG